MTKVPYRGMPPTVWAPEAPQLIRDARMVIVGYQADRQALQEILPAGLVPHENNTVQMNMYDIEADQSSGFGGFSLTYLTVEIDGHDSYAADGAMTIPGRYFAYYWNSSQRVISYAREAAGIPAMLGTRTAEQTGSTLTSTLSIDNSPAISVSASVTENNVGNLGGHLNYYSHRQIPEPFGGHAALSQLIELPLPFTVKLFDASVDDITFSFPDGHPAARLAPTDPLNITSLLYGDVTFTYSMGRVIHDYLADANPEQL
ncbi:acetoacetate decarboxylase [Gordonia paraffinivorans]|uniref:Acetoacetate decarboxylase n=1 Tax=Gordonia paraffinivorans TaxID=175628 RepID=A0ABD7UY16_9ACTN|nr:acetoacetate decarboxylase family protein [Gordonia paraffinivorans]VFA81378.1 acetoacetate decarboxylase [Gordonia paraffinivorans]